MCKVTDDKRTILELDVDDTPSAAGVRIKAMGAAEPTFYPYADPEIWTLKDRALFAKMIQSIKKVQDKEEPDDADEEFYDRQSRALLRMCVPTLPDEVLTHLSEGKRGALIMDFLLTIAKSSNALRAIGSHMPTGTLDLSRLLTDTTGTGTGTELQ